VEGVPDPTNDAMKAGHWNVDDAQDSTIQQFKKDTGLGK
jgi:hypothetical protein